MKHKLSAERARRFCQAVSADAEGRRAMPWWTSIATVARKAGLPYDEAVALAADCAKAGLVKHDQSQHTGSARRAAELPHSVTLEQAGRDLAKGTKR